jgi:hypothetical protein
LIQYFQNVFINIFMKMLMTFCKILQYFAEKISTFLFCFLIFPKAAGSWLGGMLAGWSAAPEATDEGACVGQGSQRLGQKLRRLQ